MISGAAAAVLNSQNCGRLARRRFSGEDPYLGYELVQPVIRGIQSRGVIANAKHYGPGPPSAVLLLYLLYLGRSL